MKSEDQPSPIEEAAGDKLGIERWDRPLIFRDAADAAVDNGLPYWLVMMLSGAIATLGLAMDSSAVVIGAMLVAPLLGPIVGLSLALAVGDSKLALQCFTIVGCSLIVVIATAAGLTALLPYHTLTVEITSRIRPTTLDMGVAVCSGLVAALITVARGKRLSAAIPGVAVAVALIPPLAVAGFGIAADWNTEVVWGSLLLLGANLAGIVLSGVVVFLLIGMHRSDVVDAARRWHDETELSGVAKLVCALPGADRAEVFGTAFGRAGLVLGFGVALVIPLSAALGEVVRETRVRGAVADAVVLLEADGSTSVLYQHVDIGADSSTARIRVATSSGIGTAGRDAFRRRATEQAGEPIGLRLEQLPVSAGDGSSLQALLRGGNGGADMDDDVIAWPETLERARDLLARAAWALPLPAASQAVGITLVVDGQGAESVDSVRVDYLADAPIGDQTAGVLADVLARSVGHPDLKVSFARVGSAVVYVGTPTDPAVDSVTALLTRHPRLNVDLLSAPADSAVAARLIESLRTAGIDPDRITRTRHEGRIELRLRRRE